MASSEPLTSSLRKLLSSLNTPTPVRCPKCKLLMEYTPATFFFDGTAWEVPLPFCRRCCATLKRYPSANRADA